MPKLLGELLQEQQEPFVLEAYLLERGYTRMIKSSTNGGWINSFMEKWNSRHKNTTKYRFSISSGAAKLDFLSENNAEDRRHNEGKIRQSQSMKRGRAIIAKKVLEEGKGKWGAIEENKQLSPISVLQETELEEASPVNPRKSNFKASLRGGSSTSISTHKSKQQQHHSVQGLPIMSSYSYSQYSINKRAMRQTKQLLIDCVTEVIEYHREREIGSELMRRILGPDEVWKLVCERVWEWSREPIHKTNTVHLLHHDFLDGDEREDSRQQQMEISIEIEDAILRDVIDEMLTC